MVICKRSWVRVPHPYIQKELQIYIKLFIFKKPTKEIVSKFDIRLLTKLDHVDKLPFLSPHNTKRYIV